MLSICELKSRYVLSSSSASFSMRWMVALDSARNEPEVSKKLAFFSLFTSGVIIISSVQERSCREEEVGGRV